MTEVRRSAQYTPEQAALRETLVRAIEAEKRAFMERVQPYVSELARIEGSAQVHWFVFDEVGS